MMTAQRSTLFQYRQAPESVSKAKTPGRYFDARLDMNVVMVLPGRHYVTTKADEMIVTLLGSCVSACIRDPVAGIGGLNHFLLPESENGHWGSTVDAAMRYGNHAMETLINDIVKLGGQRPRLEFKVFGGAQVIEGVSAQSIGQQNVEFVQGYLRNEGYDIAAEHLGGIAPRRIHYFPMTGKVQMRQLQRSADKGLFEREMAYRGQIRVDDDAGDAELFD